MAILRTLAFVRDPRLGYQDGLLEHVPRPCRRALDIGCGEGELARRLAPLADDVIAIDSSPEMVQRARALSTEVRNVEIVHGSFLEHPFAEGDFDFVAAIASIHHMDAGDAISRMKRLVRPGGTLAILGLARDSSLLDYARSALALSLTPFLRARRPGEWRSPSAVEPSRMPLRDPTTTYGELRRLAARCLPGARFTRHLFFRYAIVWTKC